MQKGLYTVTLNDVFELSETSVMNKYQLRIFAKRYFYISPLLYVSIMKASFKYRNIWITDGFFEVTIIPLVEF